MVIKWQVVVVGGVYVEVDEECYCLFVEVFVIDFYNWFVWWVDFVMGEGEYYDDVCVVVFGFEVLEIVVKWVVQKVFCCIKV